MTLEELKAEVQKYQYMEDTNIIDANLSAIIATRLRLGDPIWMINIGASSGGKSQILRPLALAGKGFMHRIDDVTENTFLSGMNSKEGSNSLLHRIGAHGMLVISDLTVIFSKAKEARAAILSQFRMLYDGEMVKMSGNQKEPIEWKGYLGVIAGSTPSIYHHFEEVADMGERFIYYRMKEYDARKATRLALRRKVFGKDLDDVIAGMYEEYIKGVVTAHKGEVKLSEAVEERIIEVASLAERIRTTVHMDWSGEKINRVPVPAMPMRVALQLMAIAKGLYVMRGRELDLNDMSIIDWCAYSLANEEKRRCLGILAALPFDTFMSGSVIADRVGLNTSVISNVLQNLSAVDVLERSGDGTGFTWRIRHAEDHAVIRRINGTEGHDATTAREVTSEEMMESDELSEHAMRMFGR